MASGAEATEQHGREGSKGLISQHSLAICAGLRVVSNVPGTWQPTHTVLGKATLSGCVSGTVMT